MVQRGQPFRDQVLVRRKVVVGQGFPVRQQVYAQLGIEERDFFHQPLRFQRVGGDDDQGGMLRRVLRQGQGVGRALQVGVARSGIFGGKQHGNMPETKARIISHPACIPVLQFGYV